MINNIEITKSVNSLCDKEEHIVKTINVLEEKGYVVNRSKIIKLSIIMLDIYIFVFNLLSNLFNLFIFKILYNSFCPLSIK